MRIKNIINLLNISDFIGQSKEIDIAKGVHELTSNTKKIIIQERRKSKWKRK